MANNTRRINGPTTVRYPQNDAPPSYIPNGWENDPNGIIAHILNDKTYDISEDGERQRGIDLLNALKTIDQRKYDKQLTENDREYNSVQSQLSRLMSLGIGRDAALAMLSNQATAIQNTATPSDADASIFPSQSRLNEIQSATGIFGSIFGGIQTALGLAQFGISLPSVLSANQMNSANAFLSRKSLDAFNATSQLGSFVGDAMRQGKLTEDSWKNTDALLGTLSSLFGDVPEFQSAINEFNTNPLARDSVNSLVNSRWSSHTLRPDDAVINAQREKMFAEMELSKANVTYTAEQINEIRERCHALYDDGGIIQLQAENYQQQNALLSEQVQMSQIEQGNALKKGVLLDKQSDLTEAQSVYIDQRRQEQEYMNTIQSATARAYELNFDDVTQANVDKLKLYAAEMSFYNSAEMREATFARLLADEEAARTLASLNIYRNKVDLGLAERFDGWFSVARAFDMFRCKDMIGTIENAMTQHDARFTLLTKDISNMMPMMKGSYGMGTVSSPFVGFNSTL